MGKVILGVTISLDGFAEDICDKDVNIIGSAITTQLCLSANLADELQVDIIPIFLQTGFRPFVIIDKLSIKLERIKLVELPAGRTHIRFKFIK